MLSQAALRLEARGQMKRVTTGDGTEVSRSRRRHRMRCDVAAPGGAGARRHGRRRGLLRRRRSRGPRDAGTGRLRGRRRQLGRSGRDAPLEVCRVGDHARARREPSGHDVGVPRLGDRACAQHPRSARHGGGGRIRCRPAGVAHAAFAGRRQHGRRGCLRLVPADRSGASDGMAGRLRRQGHSRLSCSPARTC